MSISKALLHRIEYLRHQMTTIALKKGFASKESIKLSQELDQLLNTYHQLKRTEANR